MPVAAIAAATVGSSLIGASASKKAAKASAAAADSSAALQKEIYDDTSAKFAPYLTAGNNALAAYNYEMGLGPAPTFGGTTTPLSIETVTARGGDGSPFHRSQDGDGNRGWLNFLAGGSGTGSTQYRVNGQLFSTLEEAQKYANANGTTTGGTAYGGFTASPSYQFQLDQGNASVNALAGSRGGLNSGATMKALADYNQGLASQEYGNYMNRLSGLVNTGTGAAANQATAGQNYATNAGNAYMAAGQAQSQGYLNQANAVTGAINNGLGAYLYQQNLGRS